MSDTPARRVTRRAVLAGGAAAAAAAVVGGRSLARSPKLAVVDQLDRSVVVIGDSITQESQDLLYEILRSDGFSSITIDAERSRRIRVSGSGGVPEAGLSVLEDLVVAGTDPTAWVIALGTNDIGSYAEAADFAELIESMLFFIPPTKPVVWVDTYLPDRVDNCFVFNGALDSILRRRGHSEIASWSAANLEPFENLLRSDQVHPNERGHVVFPTLIATTLRHLLLST